jgi:uncharacterized protein YndB with AHSA1/START domain
MLANHSGSLALVLPSDREIVLMRTFAAPRRLLFEAWTRPEHVKQWYACQLLPFEACQIDLRVGGAYRYVMLRPADGTRHIMEGVYREISPPDRLVYTERYAGPLFTSKDALVTTIFAEHAGLTTLTSTILHATREDRDRHVGSGMERGATEVLDRLETLLTTLAHRADGMHAETP